MGPPEKAVEAITATPLTFHPYQRLPVEVRLDIVQLALAELKREDFTVRLAPFAVLDSDWQKEIERSTFNHLDLKANDLAEMETICVGDRRYCVSSMNLAVGVLNDSPFLRIAPRPQSELVQYASRYGGGAMTRLLHIFKDCKLSERVYRLPLELQIAVGSRGARNDPQFGKYQCFDGDTILHLDLGGLHTVEVIGKVAFHFLDVVFFSPSSVISLLKRLPNVTGLETYALPIDSKRPESAQEAQDAIESLSKAAPHLTSLEITMKNIRTKVILENIHWWPAIGPELPFFRHLVPLSQHLAYLELNQVVDVEIFLKPFARDLADHTTPVWPLLRCIKLRGSNLWNWEDNHDNSELCRKTLFAFMRAVPSMPALRKACLQPFRNMLPFANSVVTPSLDFNLDRSLRQVFGYLGQFHLALYDWPAFTRPHVSDLQDAVEKTHGIRPYVMRRSPIDEYDQYFGGSNGPEDPPWQIWDAPAVSNLRERVRGDGDPHDDYGYHGEEPWENAFLDYGT